MKKHIPPLLWILAGVLFCAFLVVARSENARPMTQHLLFYGSLAVLDGGCLARTLINRENNSCVTNLGYKLMAIGVFFLLIVISFVRAAFFPTL